jgi:hypothetical protein
MNSTEYELVANLAVLINLGCIYEKTATIENGD